MTKLLRQNNLDSQPGHRQELETALDYHFRDGVLLTMALTPPSTGLAPNNQRLEFFGDAILQFCVSSLIFREHPHWDEGAMSKLRGLLVSTEPLVEWAHSLQISLETGPRSTKRQVTPQRKSMADAVEALIAAMYLDAQRIGEDPMVAVSRLVESRFLNSIRSAYLGIWEERDSKTTLQERAATLGRPAPVYELVERTGPDHAPSFTVRVRVGQQEGLASATTLKGAQAESARRLLKTLDSGSTGE